jgi:integrase family protein with SAM-like domain
MTTLGTMSMVMEVPQSEAGFDEAQVAAVAFLARYGGRTLEAYRHDLRMFFQWAGDHGLEVLQPSRPHIELYRSAMEERSWRRRRSTGGSRSLSSAPPRGGAPLSLQPGREQSPGRQFLCCGEQRTARSLAVVSGKRRSTRRRWKGVRHVRILIHEFHEADKFWGMVKGFSARGSGVSGEV